MKKFAVVLRIRKSWLLLSTCAGPVWLTRQKAEDPHAALEEFLLVREHSREMGSGFHHVLRWFMSKYHDSEEMQITA